jgi:dTDP-4-dehydrorhamnose 3,5-epimerase
MKVRKTPLDGLLIIEPKFFEDERGFFLETYQADRYRDFGIIDEFVQDNHSRSTKRVLRGMHYQRNNPQAQIVTVIRGHIFDVIVDLRLSSITFGKWFGIELYDSGPRQIYMAPGFAHGFCVLSELADLHYKVSCRYNSFDEGGLYWGDDEVGIDWPLSNPIISPRDAKYPRLSQLSVSQLPRI